jgi:hypothetical protein
MKEKIEQIKAKQEKLSDLLDQYKKSIENEGKRYHLFADEVVNTPTTVTHSCYVCGEKKLYKVVPDCDLKYYLVDRETQEIICYGSKKRLKSFMRLRNIQSNDIMNDVKNFGY